MVYCQRQTNFPLPTFIMFRVALQTLGAWTLTSVIAFSLAGASLAWVGVSVLTESRADHEGGMSCTDGCWSMTNATDAEKQACADACVTSGSSGGWSCSTCDSMPAGPDKDACYAGCSDSGTTGTSSDCGALYSGGAVVGYEKWDESTQISIKYDLNWKKVAECNWSSSSTKIGRAHV